MVLFATFRILDIISFTAGSLGNLHCVVSPVTGSCVTNRDTPVLFPPAILASPVALPAGIVTAAGYLLLGGTVVSAVAQTGVKSEEEPKIAPEEKVE